MTEQLGLDGTGVTTPPEVRLTERQRHALDFIGKHGPVPSDMLGALLHEFRPAEAATHHCRDERCDFCRSEGASMGARLRELELVSYRKQRGWVLWGAPREEPRREMSYDPATVEIPF